MKYLWEDSDLTAYCESGALDEPFFIPVKRTDLISLRLQIPYHIITLNGGGLPLGITLEIVDYVGTTTLCDYDAPGLDQYKFGYINDGTNRIAEYNILTTLGFRDENAAEYQNLTFPVVANDVVEITLAGTTYIFAYGIDEIPFPLIEWASGKIAFGGTVAELAASVIKINNVLTFPTDIFTTGVPACTHENFDCFRFKVTVSFATYGETIEYFTKPYKVVRCDEETTFIEGTYSNFMVDCAGHKHEAIGDDHFKNKYYLRIPGGIDKLSDEVNKDYNSRSRAYKSSIIKKYIFKSEPVPDWFVDAVQTIMLSKEVRFEGTQLYQNDVSSYSENLDINGITYKNINIPLSSSKCENIFVC